ncbi:FAD/NAD(P)-binding domain-containing protein [Auriculariales sp. MPI-PUGE-AT-0066]|nr:FAD/NAD(P)-binding domain-containing protein [Auriculariales sp. MPI-PUGE-AT-0066]
MATTSDATVHAMHWFKRWADACSQNDVAAIQALFLPHGVHRDLLCLSWDFRSLNGPAAITDFLAEDGRLSRAGLHDFQLDETTEFGAPFYYPVPGAPPSVRGIQLSFKLRVEVPAGFAKGLARLMQDADGQWKALTCFTTLWDIAGHEEPVGSPLDGFDATATWTQHHTNKVSEIESQPTVLVVGGAQNGLLTAARLNQMGIRTLVIEREAQVGDTWRQRYDSLKLHTHSRICSFLYENYPTNFPLCKFSIAFIAVHSAFDTILDLPKDRLADALEAYVKSQDLVVWTSTTVLPKPSYEAETGRWTVTVLRDGNAVQLQPKHIIMATGFAGEPIVPNFPGKEKFKGNVYHSSKRPNIKQFAGKNVVVVGAGQSGADACLDLVRNGAANITMVQRSATCVISLPLVERNVYSLWPESRSVEASDFAVNAFPSGLLCRLAAMGGTTAEKEADKDMIQGLVDAGLKLTWGEEYGQGEIGMFGILLQKFGGYWLDQGVANHIAAKRVRVKQGVEISHYEEDGLVFKDGTKTGYKGIRHTAEQLLGAEAIQGTSQVWGMDEEGEIRGMYRPTGHPGLWYAVGGFNHARFYSRHLGLMILAQELGLKA